MNNKVGIYYAYWENNWDAEFIPYVLKVKQLGFDALAVNAGTIASMGKTGRQALRSAAADTGIALSCCIGLPATADPASWDDLVAALRNIEYSGWIVMEPFIVPGGEVGRDIKVYRELMPHADRDDEARKACVFIKKVLSGGAS
jgi:sugar phosphate isomerase/epimerase